MTEFKIGIEEFIWPFSCRITPKITRESHLNTLASFWVAAPAGIQLRTDCTKSSILLITWKFCPFSGLHRLINQARTEIIILPRLLSWEYLQLCFVTCVFISFWAIKILNLSTSSFFTVKNQHFLMMLRIHIECFISTLNILPVYYRNYSKRSSNFLQFNRSRE